MGLVSDIRRRARLTQAELARRAGTSRTRLSAYEHEHTDPGLDTVDRLAAAASLELGLAALGTARVAAQVASIADDVRAGDEPMALRRVAELVSWFRTQAIGIGAIDSDPGSTGDRRWDALVGGVAEMLAREFDVAVPGWASAPSRRLDSIWFVGRARSTRSFALLEAPPALAARGVLLTAASLSSV